MTRLTLLITCFFIFSFIYCNNQEKLNHAGSTEPSLLPGSFGYDLEFLNQFDQVILLASKSDSALVIVSPKYQAKVFTSTSDGLAGKSFGWINYNAFRKKDDPHMNAYGGESRFWLGPEGGPFSIFFPKGKPMIFEHWKTPSPIDNEVWMVSDRDLSSVSLKKEMSIVNYKGIVLNILAQRNIRLLERDEIIRILGFEMTGESLRMVGYESQNSITNSGEREWNEREGMPCIWILDMFTPTDSTIIMLPFKEARDLQNSPIATTDYFGEISPDRIRYLKNVLLFKADGKSRGKLGIGPTRAKPFAGSFDAINQVMTIAIFDVDTTGKYLNQEWRTNKPPFSGDAVNAYNDGPLENGTQLGPFYELESVSPAFMLKPGETMIHNPSVFHLVGPRDQLNRVALSFFGLSLEEITGSFGF